MRGQALAVADVLPIGSAMEYVKLGKTGVDVSRLCLGCMSFGDPAWTVHPWVLDRDASMPFFERAIFWRRPS